MKATPMSVLQRATTMLATLKARMAEAAWTVLEFHQSVIEPMPDTKRIHVVLSPSYLSEDALNHDINILEKNFPASLSQSTVASVEAACAALERNPDWTSIELAPDLDCEGLDNAINQSTTWRTGSETLIVYRYPGLFLRVSDKHNCQASIELEVLNPNGLSLPTTRANL